MRKNYRPEKDLGELFVDVQMAGVFADSKTFVDCIPLHDPEAIAASYSGEKSTSGFSLYRFVQQYFKRPTNSVLAADNNRSQDMMVHLRTHWRRLVCEAADTDNYDTLIPLPFPYVVPGGRFREMFYWDSYFTIIGLLESREDDLALGMIRNCSYLVNTYGYIPNGNRTYFLSRSQPPFFAEMLKAYALKHGVHTIMEFLPALEREYHYWTQNNNKVNDRNAVSGKSVWLQGNVLNRYSGAIPAPRPEAYNKEYNWAQALPETERPEFYRNLQAACESGWDFSSRWLKHSTDRTSIQCQNLVPVCLNSLLYNCEMELSAMYQYQGNDGKCQQYEALAITRREAINAYCWSETGQAFTDYCFTDQAQNPVISLATVYPLFFGIATPIQAGKIAAIIEEKFLAAGGVVTTLQTSGEQWDAPNGWAPLQWLTVAGLSRYGHTHLATTIATRWLHLNSAVYGTEGKMMEKYNVVHPGLPGGGGNYENQDGFGWTNGVALALQQWLQTTANVRI